MIRKATALTGLMVWMFSGGLTSAWADEATQECRALNSRIHADTMRMYQRARSAGRISPAESRHLAATEQRLRHIAQALSRGGLTLDECLSLSQELSQQRNIVARMAASGGPSPVSQCRAQNSQIHMDTVRYYQRARSAGRISPAEAQHYRELRQRLSRYANVLSRDGLSLNECRSITRVLLNDRNTVMRMARTPDAPHPGGVPGVAQCRQDNLRIHGETKDLFHRARSAGRITGSEARRFRDMERRLADYYRRLTYDGLTYRECRSMTQALIDQRNRVAGMARSGAPVVPAYAPGGDPGVAQCRRDNQRIHADTLQLYQRARSAGRITGSEARRFRDMERRLADYHRRLAHNGLSFGECRSLTRALSDERRTVVHMMRSHTPGVGRNLGECRQANAQLHSNTMEYYHRARQHGRITPDETRRLVDMEQRLRRYSSDLHRGGLSLRECQALHRALVSERNVVIQMGYRD